MSKVLKLKSSLVNQISIYKVMLMKAALLLLPSGGGLARSKTSTFSQLFVHQRKQEEDTHFVGEK